MKSNAGLVRLLVCKHACTGPEPFAKINDQRLYSNLKFYFLKLMDEQQASVAARGLAALIDGLWLRGSLSRHNEFDSELARSIAYDYVKTQLQFANKPLQERQNE